MLKEGVFLQERYEILSRIGSGGMADVYKARDHKLNRNVTWPAVPPPVNTIRFMCYPPKLNLFPPDVMRLC